MRKLGFIKLSNFRRIVAAMAIVAFLWGGFLRFYNLGEQSYWMDEAFSVNAAQEIVEKGQPLLDSGKYYNRAQLYHYVLAGIMMFDDSSFALRMPALVFSLLSILIVWAVARRFFPERPEIAWITMIIMSLSYFDIAWARQVRMYSMLSFLTWFSIYLAIPRLNFNKLIQILIILLVLFVAYDTHKLALIVFPVVLGIYLSGFSFVKNFLEIHKKILFAMMLAVFALLIFGSVYYQLRYAYPLYGLWLIENLSFIFLATFFMGVLFFLREDLLEENFWNLLFVNLTLGGLIYFGLKDHWRVSYRYAFFMFPALYLLIASGFYYLYDYRKVASRIAVLSIALFLAFSLHFNLETTYALESDSSKREQKYYSYTPQPDWQKAYEYVKENSNSEDVVLSSQAVFSKIYLGTSGWSLKDPMAKAYEGKDPHVGANLLDSSEDLNRFMDEQEGYFLFDYYALQSQFLPGFRHKLATLELVFHKQENDWSMIRIYKF